MENKQTGVEYLMEQLEPAITLQSKYIKEYFDKAMEMEKQQTIDFVDWLTKEDSPYSIMYGGEPERLSTLDEDFTIEQVYEEYLKSK